MSKSPLTARPRCASLEARDVPATLRPTTVAALIAEMNTAIATRQHIGRTTATTSDPDVFGV